MIEKFTEEELKEIIEDLKMVGYEVRKTTKQRIMKEESVKAFGGNPFICQEVAGSIFRIADVMTNNYERKNGRRCVRKHIPEEIDKTYRTILSGIMEVIRPYYGMWLGFRDCDSRAKNENEELRRENLGKETDQA